MSDEAPEVPLIAMLMHQMTMDAHHTASVLTGSLWVGERRKEATLALVRTRVTELMSGSFMPMPHLITSALYPAAYEVELWLVEHYGLDWETPGASLNRCWECHDCRAWR